MAEDIVSSARRLKLEGALRIGSMNRAVNAKK